jgi:hypothetical protein
MEKLYAYDADLLNPQAQALMKSAARRIEKLAAAPTSRR